MIKYYFIEIKYRLDARKIKKFNRNVLKIKKIQRLKGFVSLQPLHYIFLMT